MTTRIDNNHDHHCDLAIVGSGLAGMAAAIFAARRGIEPLMIGRTSQIVFAAGFIDLMGVHPPVDGRIWKDPFAALRALKSDLPAHPLARIPEKKIKKAMDLFLSVLESCNLSYTRRPAENVRALTAVGTLKPTYAVPRSMWAGVEALERKDPCLLVGIEGLRGYSARKIKETLGHRWPGLSTATIRFPETESMVEVYTEPMARALEVEQTRAALAERIRPHLQGVRVVGLPAILGIYRTDEVMADLEAQLGVPLFEIPTMPPSLPGVRMREALENNLAGLGIRHFSGGKVTHVQKVPQGFTLEITGSNLPSTIHAKRVILATGRFLGRGLRADRKKIREALFNLPIYQPLERANWHRRTFLNPHGHLINQAGVEVDDRFRPVDGEEKPLYTNLYAVGTILAHQDWIRTKCGSGLSIATAYAAVEACLQ